LPCLGRLDVTLPEWPSAALRRAHRIDGATPLTIPEDAIAVPFLAQSPAAVPDLGVQADHLVDGLAAELSNGGEVVVVDPHEAGFAGAAVAAHRTGEAQTVSVPGFTHQGRPPFRPSIQQMV